LIGSAPVGPIGGDVGTDDCGRYRADDRDDGRGALTLGAVFPRPSEGDDDDLAVLMQTTLGPFHLDRRLGGPSPSDVDHADHVDVHPTGDDDQDPG
jgi:hypothetical protein